MLANNNLLTDHDDNTLTGYSPHLSNWRDSDGNSREHVLSAIPTVGSRATSCNLVLRDAKISQQHAHLTVVTDQVHQEDLGSQNGAYFNREQVRSTDVMAGNEISLKDSTLRLASNASIIKEENPLQVTVTGGGPVGLTFALLLENLMGDRVAIKVYDGRWMKEDSRIVWKNEEQGNVRRQQVVTIQSRQYLKLPEDIQKRLFREGHYSEMWPVGPDSIRGYSPRNVRIAHVEDVLLEIANEKSAAIQLIPEWFSPEDSLSDLKYQHILAICEGAGSRTRECFLNKFGTPDTSMYSLGTNHLYDTVLGLRVKSDLPDSMSVLLTIGQNRFLLNSLKGEGFLNMRLTDEEQGEVRGIDINEEAFKPCIQREPCLMESSSTGEFRCAKHGTLFLPALLKDSPLWARMLEGLNLFGVKQENFTAVTAFRLEMIQRPRFTTQLYASTQMAPGTFGALLGDAANSIHFWPGRGLNSGISSAISLAECLDSKWKGRALRAADFFRHEGNMAMLQYRHKSRAWEAMITTEESDGTIYPIKDKIAAGIAEGEARCWNANDDIEVLMDRLIRIRKRLEPRIAGLPDDQTLKAHLSKLNGPTLHTLVASGPWETGKVGGEEVDVDILCQNS